MKVKKIVLDEDELPAKVTVVMSAGEAAYLTALCGKQSSASVTELLPEITDGPEFNHSVYDSLTGLFNAFYDDGVTEAIRRLR